jgi:hypothetical protein
MLGLLDQLIQIFSRFQHSNHGKEYLILLCSTLLELTKAVSMGTHDNITVQLNELYFWTLSIVWCLKKIEE